MTLETPGAKLLSRLVKSGVSLYWEVYRYVPVLSTAGRPLGLYLTLECQ